ncbi:CDF family Co(II)/Ni(II) efflux transporter DmeF [Edaphosphingomonas haloaromaticamans]|uniref:Cadmium, cobalt and zinc/H(+)-K(+) antiporter n=1 Tax=Edaphosphingomonas haloaromaticamans TaxID=653954 RepID=A0A1S1HEC1_9SPHN|nr:CDF family Co(II)/Ni(II) efflux transporter DmeF [Sphingomonas haloaromaticamans]OHT18840.1 Cadmium, cobalt and zinc/H(+)-K(+) antiporter [Sphingomonas haloaromaticamans]
MHVHTITDRQHDHAFLGAGHQKNERRARAVIALTFAMMVVEVAAGIAFGSMALLADGIHMATHAGALALAAAAYAYARRHLHNPRFAFGTGKVGDLSAFASAIMLAVFAALIGWESIERLLNPGPIDFGDATLVAVLGLIVNLASAWMLGGGHGHDHGHAHGSGEHHHHDNNLRAAYVHVLADALTSVLAIFGLLAGRYAGWVWMDPMVGILGAVVILRWSWGLLRDTGGVLLDAVPDEKLPVAIRDALERGGDRVTDLHVWRVGPDHNAAVISLASADPRPPAHYKEQLVRVGRLCHLTVEVEPQ